MGDINEIYALLSRDEGKTLIKAIDQEFESLGVSQRQISEALGIPRRTLQRILEGEAQKIDFLTILKLAEFLNLDLYKLSQFFTFGLPAENIGELERARKAGFILRNFDLDVLKKIGFIEDVSNFETIEQLLKKHFNLETLEEYANEIAMSLFSRTGNKSCDKATKFWISTAFQRCEALANPNPYNRELLGEVIPRIRAWTMDEEDGLLRAVRGLYEAGVTVIVQGYIPKIQIRGATFMVKGKPCIVVSDFNKRLDTIWFTLAHELYHVLKDLGAIQKIGYHLTVEDGESNEKRQKELDFVNEDLANEFAEALLLSADKLRYIKAFLDIPAMVEGYARKWGVHPAIIYGWHLNKHREEYMKYRNRIPRPTRLLKRFFEAENPWEQVPMEEQVNGWKKTIYKQN